MFTIDLFFPEGDVVSLRIHPSSVLYRVQPDTIVFHSIEKDDKDGFTLRNVSAVDASWMPNLLPHMYQLI